MTIETRNARITEATVQIENHNILTAGITLDYGNLKQGFGGYMLGVTTKRELELRRSDAVFCSIFLREVMETVGVRRWSDLVGMTCRAKSEYARVQAIGHIIEDRWFSPDDMIKQLEITNDKG